MIRKLMIVQWSGPLPDWIDRWRENTVWVSAQGHGWDFLLDADEDSIRSHIDSLGVKAPILEGRKLADFRPALGEMYAEEIAAGGYEWWGHTDLDCVYGRLWDYVTDELLADCDVFSNDPAPRMCGPFSLYRTATATDLFRRYSKWEAVFESDEFFAFDERDMSRAVIRSQRRVIHRHWHGPDSMYVHFRKPKVYPDLPASFFESRLVAA